MTIATPKNRWTRDLHRFLALKSQFLLSGNTKDLHIRYDSHGQVMWHGLTDYLALELEEYGYAHVIHYNPMNGFSMSPLLSSPTQTQALFSRLQIPQTAQHSHNIDIFIATMERIVQHTAEPIALIADFASQYLVHNEQLVQAEHNAFTRALVLSQQAQPLPYGKPAKPFFNSVLWIVDKEADLPDWMTVNNPKIRPISIAKPDHHSRRAIAEKLLTSLPDTANHSLSFDDLLQQFIDATEGLLLLDLIAIIDLARTENIARQRIKNAVRRYKVGVTEDPWKKLDRNKVRSLQHTIQQRLKGQDHAITHMTDIIKRAITGIHSNNRGNRPRGVVFLAGPTGVGKTELAKTITQLLFGDENAYIRFDMSEFSSEHSDQRLIGAPPGYVGYDMGGELTNAVREKPFSVVLFDEIEKAHPRILDKFLQILDDGRLTSGRGDPVYFSETLIIFTSNLGIYRTNADGQREENVSPDQPFATVQHRIKQEISHYFKVTLNRPEILNRIGENIIVFDFIRESVGLMIFEAMLEEILQGIAEYQQIQLHVDEAAKIQLQHLCLDDLSNGGRGIRNMLEAHFINPLSRGLFDANATAGEQWKIVAVAHNEHQTELTLEQ
jgi:ATP-dependent Clp protease ATP-binding subunit ClpA